jgi:hypothetical protein
MLATLLLAPGLAQGAARRSTSRRSCAKSPCGAKGVKQSTAGRRRKTTPAAKTPRKRTVIVKTPRAPSPVRERAATKEAASGAPSEKTPSRKADEVAPLPQDEGQTVTDPIDSRYLTRDPFGSTSFWLQPWRAYFDTWPASALTNSLGIQFNVKPSQAEAVAQLLQESGFKLARREIPWAALSYEDPTQLTGQSQERIDTILSAMHNHGLRPLLLLNANSDQPGPAKQVRLTTLAPAAPGAMTVRLDQASAALVVPGKTGFDGLTWGTGPDVLITAVSPGGLATLSRPLRATLPAGDHRGMTLRYAPFQNPLLPDGEPNPVFQETLAGWLGYVAAVNAEATRILGAGNYDLEIWNELTFGSQFLNYQHYYQPPDARTAEAQPGAVEPQDAPLAPEDGETEESLESRADPDMLETIEHEAEPEASEAEAEPEGEGEEGSSAGARRSGVAEEGATEEESQPRDTTKAVIDRAVTKAVIKSLLKETVAFVRNPANGISPAVGITDGFASQTPFPSGAYAPAGLTALSKHLYNGVKQFPAAYREGNLKPLNAFGLRDTAGGRGFKPLFVPQMQALFPEYYLTAMTTETMVRDIAPITTKVYGLPHGRNVGPANGPPVQKWMTEYNLGSGRGTVMEPDGITPAGVVPSAADRSHFEAKALLRSLVATINKGLSREYFFGAAPGALSLIDKGFYEQLEAHPESYPGREFGGETMSGLRELMATVAGPGPEGSARQLKLLSITQEGDHAQFSGDGTAAHPSLYDRDVLAVLPFQSSPKRFVIPVYVMTRDLLTLYEPWQSATDVRRFDLPEENFRIVLGNLPEAAAAPAVSAYDPLRGETTPARLLSRHGETAELEIAATDYPRLLTLSYE